MGTLNFCLIRGMVCCLIIALYFQVWRRPASQLFHRHFWSSLKSCFQPQFLSPLISFSPSIPSSLFQYILSFPFSLPMEDFESIFNLWVIFLPATERICSLILHSFFFNSFMIFSRYLLIKSL